ncbi:hypothetical protein B0H12DRAFT_1117045 [Mycena haematopus]|nr:hypothetical protein B0H12DRAFT_1117045 [Mycena haematopus]
MSNLAAAYLAAQEYLRIAEDNASDYSDLLGDGEDCKDAYESSIRIAAEARTACETASGPAKSAAYSIVNDLLRHYCFDVGPTFPMLLQTALLEDSFQSLAQQLHDASAPSCLIVDFCERWRYFHGLPDIPHGTPDYYNALAPQHSFGAAVALLVDTRYVPDKHLEAFIVTWNAAHNVEVSERGVSVPPYNPPAPPIVASSNSNGSTGSYETGSTTETTVHSRTPTPTKAAGSAT